MSKVENFDLSTLLTMTTGYNCVDDFNKVWKLVWFVCNDSMIGPMGLGIVKGDVKKHILTIHPQLKDVKYQKGQDMTEFLAEQEEKFGSFLPVTKLGIKLPNEYTTNNERLVKSLKNNS